MLYSLCVQLRSSAELNHALRGSRSRPTAMMTSSRGVCIINRVLEWYRGVRKEVGPAPLPMDLQNPACVPACCACAERSRDSWPSIPPQIYDPIRTTTKGSCASSPPLPLVISVKECILKRSVSRGWGFTLRGTKSGYGKDKWIYNCFVESISDSGAAEVSLSGVVSFSSIFILYSVNVSMSAVILWQYDDSVLLCWRPHKVDFHLPNFLLLDARVAGYTCLFDLLWSIDLNLQVLHVQNKHGTSIQILEKLRFHPYLTHRVTPK